MKEKAVALQFLPTEHRAPRVLYVGEGNLARKTIEIAEKNGVQVVKDPSLAEALSSVPVGQEIPEPLYLAVATLFQFLLESNPSFQDKWL